MPDTPASRTSRRAGTAEHVLLALLALVPQLLARPGVAVADTKSYLYLDPGRFLRQSASMWDPTVGLGTVTHQQIGYLFPMGPFFWATHAAGIPTWVAQRLWVAALLFGAGAGVLLLCRTLRLPAPASTVAATAYMLSPYFLQYVGRISVILLPWAALGWLVALVERGLRRPGWRVPAVLALLVAAMSSVNASGAVYVGMAPVLWLLYAGVTGLHPWGRVWALLWRTALLGAATSAWWITGLALEGAFGVDVLRYTETVPVVSSTSLSSEVLRGLGYWYFYGGDSIGPWVPTLTQFTQQLWLLALGYGTALLAIGATVVTRWRHHAYFVLLVLTGTVLAVGAYPFAAPSPAGRVLRGAFTRTTFGLAMRSTDRATPLVLLGLAVLLAAGITALGARSRAAALLVAGAALASVLAADPAVWNGTTVPTHFAEPAVPPRYVGQAAAALNTHHRATRVLAVPGENFAAYRYGDTIDPVWPALLRRPFVTREQQVVSGSLATEDLLYGLDDPMQNGTADASAIAPVARLMSAGDVLVQNDLDATRYDQPDPAVFWSLFRSPPAGLSAVVGFGTPRPTVSPAKPVDEQTLALPGATAPIPPVAVAAVAGTRPVVRAEPVAGALVLDGDGVGLVDAAGLGLLARDPAVVYAGSLDTSPSSRRAVLPVAGQLVVTDSNRRQAHRWNTLKGVAGRTLAAGEPQPADPDDAPLDIFPGAPADAQTTTSLSGVRSVTASSYGNSVAYLPEVRPVQAIDGNLDTAWETGPFADPRGQWWQVTLTTPVTADHVTLVQPQGADDSQWITRVTLRFDGRAPVRVALGPVSRAGGQVIGFRRRSFRALRVTIDATNLSPRRARGAGASPVGLAEVALAGTRAVEQVDMPSDLLRHAGPGSLGHRLTLVMTRQRVAPVPPRSDPEPALDRGFWLPTARAFALTGTARIDTRVPDTTVDQEVGRAGSDGSGVVATSRGRLPGDLRAAASAALDGDPSTVSSPGFGAPHQTGQRLAVTVPAPITFDHLDLQVVADGRHSVPTALLMATENGSAAVSLPPVTDGSAPGTVVAAPVRFPALTGRRITVTVTGVRLERTHDYYGNRPIALPIAIAELGLPGVRVPAPPPAIPAPCRDDLVRVDGRPVSVRVSGGSAAALSGAGLPVSLCGGDAGGLVLGPGTHTVVASLGHRSGMDLDQLVLDSAAGGGPQAGDTGGSLVAPAPPPAPAVTVVGQDATSVRARVSGAGDTPYWLVLGQSRNDAWQATSTVGRSLGQPELVDGFANGWIVRPGALGGSGRATVTLRWAPQGAVDLALVLGAAAGLVCLVLALRPRRRRLRPAPLDAHAVEAVGGPVLRLGGGPPTERGPLGAAARRPALLPVTAAALGTGALAAAVAAPWWGAVAAVAVAAAALARPARLLLATAAPALVVAAVTTMVVGQAGGHFPADGSWPAHFGPAHSLIWGAVLLLVADVVVERLRRPRGPGP